MLGRPLGDGAAHADVIEMYWWRNYLARGDVTSAASALVRIARARTQTWSSRQGSSDGTDGPDQDMI